MSLGPCIRDRLSQAARAFELKGFVSGHDFSRAESVREKEWALAPV
jgi:hypothetical protein